MCNFNNEVAFDGNCFVQKNLRGKGIITQIINNYRTHFGDRNVGINGVEDMVKVYLRKGFIQSFPIEAYAGQPDEKKLSFTKGRYSLNVAMYTPGLFEEVLQYDTEIHTIPRREFLKCWLDENITTTYCALESGKIKGYGCVQPTDQGCYVIGPMYADTKDIAHDLFTNLMLSVPHGSDVSVNVAPGNNLPMGTVKVHSMSLQLRMYRMYTKEVIKLDLDRVYAFSTAGIGLV